jgi:drug/metabolite transporter (DMT)-like permease
MIVGILLGLGAAVSQSLSYLATRHYVQRRPRGASLQLLVLGHIWMGVFAVLLLPFVWPTAAIPWSPLALPLIGETLFYIAGQFSLATALKYAEASRVSPLMTSKLILTATLASLFGQPVGATSAWITPLQWFAVLLCLFAAISINFSGGRIRIKALLAIAAAAGFFALSDYGINLMIKAMLTSPGIDKLHASLLTEVFCYLTTGVLALPLLKPLGSRIQRDWAGAVPFGLAWFVAMVFLFLAFSSVGVLLGSILQCTRGFITIILGAGLMYAGQGHIEAKQPRGVIARRLLAGLLMFVGIALYVIRDPGKLTLNWRSLPVSRSASGQAARVPCRTMPITNS